MSDYKFEQIPASEITSKGVKSLATRPNRPSQYGEGNLSASALKQRFDDLAELVIEKYNEMATILSGKDALKYLNLPSGYFWSDAQNPSIADLLTRIIDGSGNVVAVDPVEKSVKDVSSIAESLYTLYTEVFAFASLIKDDMLPTKQDNLSFDGEYNAETNKAATVETITRKVAEIVANAPENFDTLKELSDWLTSHEGSAAEMNSAIKQNAEDIKDLDSATKQNTDDIAEVTQKVNSLPDEITFEGLPDRPFGGVPALNLTRTMNKGNVTLSDGGILYLQTDETRTADELVGGTVSVSRYGDPSTYTISKSSIADESSDGIVLSVSSAYVYVVYNTEYVPTNPSVPTPVSAFPSVGIYFYRDAYGDYEVMSLETQGNVTPIDNRYINLKGHPDYRIKLYKHNVYIHSGNIGMWTNEAKILLSYVSTSATPITTLEELWNSPAVAYDSPTAENRYLKYTHATYHHADEANGDRDVKSIEVSRRRIYINYVTAYTIPVTLSSTTHDIVLTNAQYRVDITDTVTEV